MTEIAANVTQELLSCNATLQNVTEQLSTLTQAFETCGCSADPCAFASVDNFALGLHIGAVFIILVASALGCALPILASHLPKSDMQTFIIVCGKCAGTGVILAVSLIHMLVPAHEALTSPCVPPEFQADYPFAFMFCIIGITLMHLLEFLMKMYFRLRMAAALTSTIDSTASSSSSDVDNPNSSNSLTIPKVYQDPLEPPPEHHHHHHAHHVHSDPLKLYEMDRTSKKLIEAYMIEVGVSVHSILVGLAVGVVSGSALIPLLIALVFHQFFEGLALGARIADANLPKLSEFILGAIFSLAAPIGISVGIGVYAVLNTNGPAFLLVQGILDSLCAGVLLYTGFMLLLHDFPQDAEIQSRGKYGFLKVIIMFACLWIGLGGMAFLGKFI